MQPQFRTIGPRKRIALVGNKAALSGHELMATGTTGKLLEEALQVPVRRFLSGPLGGDQQIGSSIAQGLIDMLIFFWDPMQAQPHDTDVKALLRIAVTWNILLASDESTADFLFSSPWMTGSYELMVPDYTDYLDRKV
jgi:methylglyoxal synthase